MKKIDINSLESYNDCIISSQEVINNINGGCAVRIIYCKAKGTCFVGSYMSSCYLRSFHGSVAVNAVKTTFKKSGKYRVTGTTTGTVTYLGPL